MDTTRPQPLATQHYSQQITHDGQGGVEGSCAGSGAVTAWATSSTRGASAASSGSGSSSASAPPNKPHTTTANTNDGQDGVEGSCAGSGADAAWASPSIRGTSIASSGIGSSGANVPPNRIRTNQRCCLTHIAGSRPYKSFLRHIPIYLQEEESTNHKKGRTWIELLIIYKMMGYDTPASQPKDDGSPALIKWSLG